MSSSAEELVKLLDIETLDTNLFRGSSPDTDRQRVFGGQVAAQALIAAIRTVDEGLQVHSLHAYFLRPGDTTVPIIYDAERIRDGRSFETRRVVARQHGRGIFYLTANFQRPEDGFDHQDAMPEVPGPDEGLTFAQLHELRSGDKRSASEFAKEWAALDTRYLGNSAYPGHTRLAEDTDRPARAQVWVRVNGDIGDDPVLHTATFTYASDLTLLGATLVPHGVEIGSPRLMPASLDHAIWFHRPFRADRWWLYDQWSPSAQGGRGLSLARVFTEDGALVATVAQEGLIRQRRP
ncbi:MAG TPA: acyl-CoA thioesterase II [Nocardioides sp.]|jgi:acyl-CoA thioesterase-2|nr:acyl-CoA thioesterase II [Nocardioides sp.]